MSQTEPPFPAGHPLHRCEAQIDALRECGRLFHTRGWSVGTSSNYSAVISQDPLHLVLTASGKDKGRLGRDDFVLVDENGQPTSSDQPKSSAETLLHVAVAQELPAGAILHTHSVWGTVLSEVYGDQGCLYLEGYEMLKGLEGIRTHETSHRVPIFENTQDIADLASRVRPQLTGDNAISHGYLIRKHGLYTWGATVEDARRHIEVYEFLFECLARQLMLTGQIPSSMAATAS